MSIGIHVLFNYNKYQGTLARDKLKRYGNTWKKIDIQRIWDSAYAQLQNNQKKYLNVLQ